MAEAPTVLTMPKDVKFSRYRLLTIGDPTLDCLETHGRAGRSPVNEVIWGSDILVTRRNLKSETSVSLIARPVSTASEKAIWRESRLDVLSEDLHSDPISPLGIFGGYIFYSSQPRDVANGIELWALSLTGGEPRNLSSCAADWYTSEMKVTGNLLTFRQMWTGFTRDSPSKDRYRSRCFQVSVNKGELSVTLLPGLGDGLVVFSLDGNFAATPRWLPEGMEILLLKRGAPVDLAQALPSVLQAVKVRSVSNQGDVLFSGHLGADEQLVRANKNNPRGLNFEPAWQILAMSPNGDYLLLRERTAQSRKAHAIYSRDGSFCKIDCVGYNHVEWEAIEDDRSLFGRGIGIDPADRLSFRRDVLIRGEEDT